MKTSTQLLALLLIAALPASLFAASGTDEKIESAATNSYNFRVVLNRQVDAHAEDGVVTLTGTVDDPDLRGLAEDTVRNLPGVTGVNNEIKIADQPSEHSDAWISLKIHTLLLLRANVSATDTKVEVHDGAVVLSGTADNEAQKELTEAYVKEVAGVRSVDNELVIKNTTDADHPHAMGEAIDDASITTEVKSTLLFHSATSARRTKVTTVDGVVHLEGEANSPAERDLATVLAERVRGVKSVQNDMTVRPE